jgi:hypothetical protein
VALARAVAAPAGDDGAGRRGRGRRAARAGAGDGPAARVSRAGP